MMTRRKAIKAAALVGATLATLPDAFAQNTNVPAVAAAPSGPFTLPPLPYSYDALEPYIDARTMEIHHNRHHAAFVANLNRAVAEFPDAATMSVDDMLKNLNAIPEKIRTTVRNNGGGHINHSLFWDVLKADGGEPSGDLATAINSTFGSFDTFKENFTRASLGIFGSGWAWLVIGPNRQLSIVTTPNQDSPVMQGQQPVLGLDMWEHAFYLKYQYRRPDYVAAFYHVINWDFVAKRYKKFSD
jgi:Fe-Mn family superoxide dismutase